MINTEVQLLKSSGKHVGFTHYQRSHILKLPCFLVFIFVLGEFTIFPMAKKMISYE